VVERSDICGSQCPRLLPTIGRAGRSVAFFAWPIPYRSGLENQCISLSPEFILSEVNVAQAIRKILLDIVYGNS
jgi:hypothetical protein